MEKPRRKDTGEGGGGTGREGPGEAKMRKHKVWVVEKSPRARTLARRGISSRSTERQPCLVLSSLVCFVFLSPLCPCSSGGRKNHAGRPDGDGWCLAFDRFGRSLFSICFFFGCSRHASSPLQTNHKTSCLPHHALTFVSCLVRVAVPATTIRPFSTHRACRTSCSPCLWKCCTGRPTRGKASSTPSSPCTPCAPR